MNEPPLHPRSWWTTLPGILTGIAALVTAGTGLIVALVQGGLLGHGAASRGAERPAIALPSSVPEPAANARTASAAAPPAVAQSASRQGQQDGVPPLVLREMMDLRTMQVAVLGIDRTVAGNALRVRVSYRIQAGERLLEWAYFRDMFRLIADGAPRTMERTIIQPQDRASDYVLRLPPGIAVDVVSEFLIPRAEDLVLEFTELVPGLAPAARGERVVRRRVPG